MAAHARMRFELGAVRHVNGARGNVVHGREAVVTKRREIRPVVEQPAVGGQRRQRQTRRQQVGEFLQQGAIAGCAAGAVLFGARAVSTGRGFGSGTAMADGAGSAGSAAGPACQFPAFRFSASRRLACSRSTWISSDRERSGKRWAKSGSAESDARSGWKRSSNDESMDTRWQRLESGIQISGIEAADPGRCRCQRQRGNTRREPADEQRAESRRKRAGGRCSVGHPLPGFDALNCLSRQGRQIRRHDGGLTAA